MQIVVLNKAFGQILRLNVEELSQAPFLRRAAITLNPERRGLKDSNLLLKFAAMSLLSQAL